jgi:hypothetical protein
MAKSSLFDGRCGKQSHAASPPSVPPQRNPKTSPLRSRNQRPCNCGAAEQPDTAAWLRARLLKINIIILD